MPKPDVQTDALRLQASQAFLRLHRAIRQVDELDESIRLAEAEEDPAEREAQLAWEEKARAQLLEAQAELREASNAAFTALAALEKSTLASFFAERFIADVATAMAEIETSREHPAPIFQWLRDRTAQLAEDTLHLLLGKRRMSAMRLKIKLPARLPSRDCETHIPGSEGAYGFFHTGQLCPFLLVHGSGGKAALVYLGEPDDEGLAAAGNYIAGNPLGEQIGFTPDRLQRLVEIMLLDLSAKHG